MPLNIHLAARDWDYLMPLALGDLKSPEIALHLHRLDALPADPATDERFDAAEMSLSRFVDARVAGDDRMLGVPNFLMRAFRHRCIITRLNSPLRTIEDLRGTRIGLTGWQDSGNVWTRAILRRVGIGIDGAKWFLGRLTAAHPVMDRIGKYGKPGHIEVAPEETPLLELLEKGLIDAVFTPFMPPGFFDRHSDLRLLLDDCRQAEITYYQEVGYVPGIHLLGVKRQACQDHPWLPSALSDLVDKSSDMWVSKRKKYCDTTPWLFDELKQVSTALSADWNTSGLAANWKMVSDFCDELYQQGIIDSPVQKSTLFA